jgi:DNA polymerase V
MRAQHGDIIIVSLESEMTVKELHLTLPTVYLLPRDSAYQPILIEEGMVLEVFGVVTNVVRSLKRGGKS